MASFNKVILLGNLTRDPQLRYLPNNTAVCDFGMAINHRWRDREGNQRDEVCFVDVTAFGRQAEVLNQYMAKGRPLLVEGRLRYESWTAQDGSKRSRLGVVADNFQFTGSRDDARGGGGGGEGGRQAAPASAGRFEEEPGREKPRYDGPGDDYGADSGPPSGDDIPF